MKMKVRVKVKPSLSVFHHHFFVVKWSATALHPPLFQLFVVATSGAVAVTELAGSVCLTHGYVMDTDSAGTGRMRNSAVSSK